MTCIRRLASDEISRGALFRTEAQDHTSDAFFTKWVRQVAPTSCTCYCSANTVTEQCSAHHCTKFAFVKHSLVQSAQLTIVQCLPTEEAQAVEIEDGETKQQIFVEEEEDHAGDAGV